MFDTCAISPKPLLTVSEALASIQLAIQPLVDFETVSLQQALGRILAQSVTSPINLPFDRNSAMDGYAFISTDAPQSAFSLQCVGTSWAGKPFQGQVQASQCIRIFTGAVLPAETDSVVMQEHVQVTDKQIQFPEHTKLYQNVRQAGEDIQKGSCLISAPKKLTIADISLLAAAGVAEVVVKRRVKIAFFSTGDELVSLGQPLTTGKIYDSNRYSLQGLLTDGNYTVADLGIIPDNPIILERQLLVAAENYDVVLTTGGASVGDADYVKDTLARCGEVDFWKIALKPGKPLAFGKIGTCYFFGLPGNPVSVMVTFERIVAPALRQLAGELPSKPLKISAVCTSRLKKAPGRQEYQRGVLTQNENGQFFVAAAGGQGSHMLAALSRANCYICLPLDCAGVNIGENVFVEPFGVTL